MARQATRAASASLRQACDASRRYQGRALRSDPGVRLRQGKSTLLAVLARERCEALEVRWGPAALLSVVSYEQRSRDGLLYVTSCATCQQVYVQAPTAAQPASAAPGVSGSASHSSHSTRAHSRLVTCCARRRPLPARGPHSKPQAAPPQRAACSVARLAASARRQTGPMSRRRGSAALPRSLGARRPAAAGCSTWPPGRSAASRACARGCWRGWASGCALARGALAQEVSMWRAALPQVHIGSNQVTACHSLHQPACSRRRQCGHMVWGVSPHAAPELLAVQPVIGRPQRADRPRQTRCGFTQACAGLAIVGGDAAQPHASAWQAACMLSS